MRLFKLVVCFFLFYISFSQTFEAQISDNKVGLNDSFEISFTLYDNGKNFSPPPFSDFMILRGPSKSSSTSFINGKMSQKLTYTYVLKPKKIGVFTILPASIKVKGKTIGTQPVTIQVEKGLVSNKSNTPYDIVSRKVHLAARVNKEKCYIGEPIVITYQLYFNVNIGNASQKAIKYSGFWADEIDLSNQSKKTTQYKGEQYNSIIIKQVVLVPQKSGKHAIKGLGLDLVASVPTNNRDFFNMTISESVNYSLHSNDIVINVLELPIEGKPMSFSGAVGNFKLETKIDKDSINTNESVIFSVKLSGSGNLNLLNSPRVDFDDALEIFDPKNSDKINVNNRGITGYKKEEYIIVPRNRGVYDLPLVEFNFFNPKTKKYITLNTEEKSIKVGGPRFDNNSNETERSVNKEKINLISQDIRFIKTEYKSSFLSKNFSSTILFYILLLFPFIFFGLSILYKNGHLNKYISFETNTFKLVSKKLILSKSLFEKKNFQAFHSLLLDILFTYVSGKFLIKKANLSVKKIKEVLELNNVDQNYIVEYLKLIKRLELYKYSGYEENLSEVNEDLHKNVSDLINKIETSI